MAIGQVESGLHPWAVNLNGTSHYPKTKEAASKLLIKRKGHTAVGCMQLAVRWHGMHFKNNAAMLDPKDNIDYAARFLVSLYKRTGDWRKAVMGYHGGTAEQNKVYLEKIARQVVIDFD